MKRIVGLILAAVMLTLSLVSCGYSFAKDDLSSYATFSAEDKAAFEKIFENIVIEDGDFTTDPATREKKVLDSIYAALANAVGTTDKKTVGVPGARDVVYYCYYVTAEIEGALVTLNAANMKPSSAASVQLGATFDDDKVGAAIAEAIKGFDFKDKAYTTVTSGKTEAGNVAYVSYSYSYKVTDNGVESEKSGKYENERVVIEAAPAEGATATTFASYLCGKNINSAIEKITVTEEGKGEVTYSNIKVNWVAKGDALTTVKDVTYTEDYTANDTANKSQNLKDKELTYYIYPVNYISVPDYNATNVVDKILGKNITADALYEIILGEEYANLDEKEDKAKIEERAELLKKYVTSENESLDAVAESLAKLYKDIEDAKKTLDEQEEALTKANTSQSQAKTELDKATEDKKAELQAAYDKAVAAVKTATEARDAAKTIYDNKVKEKTDKIAALLAVTVDGETVGKKIERGYKVSTYNYLQEIYNEEIRMNLAKEVYHFLTKNITVTGTPEEAVDMTYDQLIENYENDFYTGNYGSDNKVSNYKQYKGSFKKFLIAAVTSDIKSVTTYAEAKKAIREKAEEYVKPIVQIYVAAKAYDVTVTDKEYKEYKENPDNNYSYLEYSYGANSVLHAYQFDKLMDLFLAYEEVKADADANGYVVVTFKYTKVVKYTYGEPASEKTETKAE